MVLTLKRLDKTYDHLYPDVYCWISIYAIGKGNPFKVSGREGKKDPDKGPEILWMALKIRV